MRRYQPKDAHGAGHLLLPCQYQKIIWTISPFTRLFVYIVSSKLEVTYGFVGNPGFVGNSTFHNSTRHPKYDERNVILQRSRFKWKFNNAVHVSKASCMSMQLAIQWICGQHANLWKIIATFVKIAVILTKVLEYACYAVSGNARIRG